MAQLGMLAERAQITLLEHLDREVSVPMLDRHAQGDLLILPNSSQEPGEWQDVPREGVVLVQGQHAHLLIAEGAVRWMPVDGPVVVALIEIPEGAEAWIVHAEHGAAGLAPGVKQVRRQREGSAAAIRQVAD